MGKNRLEAFSDGVLAIIITIMVLELKVPAGQGLGDLLPLLPVLLSYVLSFTYVAIYWNNHHHLLQPVFKVTRPIMWGNLHLLFWLSLLPFATAWMGANHLAIVPSVLYGIVLLMAAVSYHWLQWLIIRCGSADPAFKQAIGKDLKGKASILIYLAATLTALKWPSLAQLIYVVLALVWVIPDKRIEENIYSRKSDD